MNRIQLQTRLPFIVVVFAGQLVAAEQNVELSIGETLERAEFNTVSMPPEKALISKYGEGKTFVRNGDIYHVFYLRDSHLWLRCKSDSDDKRYKPISEFLISSIDLNGVKVPPKAAILSPNLKGIRVGEKIDKALKQWGTPLRKYSEKLGAVPTTVYEFFPNTLVQGSCLRFFVRDKIIVGFAFSSEE